LEKLVSEVKTREVRELEKESSVLMFSLTALFLSPALWFDLLSYHEILKQVPFPPAELSSHQGAVEEKELK